MTGTVYLIGAGCGTYDLITLRGLNCLRKADVVIYDALIDSALLLYTDPAAEQICVGKRAGGHSAPQAEINALLVQKAREGHTVARLKGGDPFVFGRGGEEIAALRAADIPFAVVSGISSAIAVPELAGIPVTHRGVSRSFHVITAHTASSIPDFSRYAALDGTLVFLMGLQALANISAGLIRGGMSPDTPAAVISDGASPKQKVVRGTLLDITEKARAAACTAPAVIVVGETAAMDCAPQRRLPLCGVSVTVTGTAEFCRRLTEKLAPLGAEVLPVPHIRCEEYDPIPRLEDALRHIEDYGCIALTGKRGAEIFLRRLRAYGIDMRRLAAVKIAVIGTGTAEYLKEYGIFADIVPDTFKSAALAKAIAIHTEKQKKNLILRAEKGSPALTDILRTDGFAFDDIRLYDTHADAEKIPKTINTDYIIFGSAAGIRSFLESGAVLSVKTRVLCIGPVTASAQSQYQNVLIAKPHTVDGLVDTIIREKCR